MGVYDGERQDALDLIREFGEQATIRVFTEARDPDKEWEAADPSYVDISTAAVFLNFSDNNSSGERYWNGTLVHQGDKKVFVAAKGLSGNPNLHAQVIRADGSKWTVHNLKLLDPNGEKILYTLQVRQ